MFWPETHCTCSLSSWGRGSPAPALGRLRWCPESVTHPRSAGPTPPVRAASDEPGGTPGNCSGLERQALFMVTAATIRNEPTAAHRSAGALVFCQEPLSLPMKSACPSGGTPAVLPGCPRMERLRPQGPGVQPCLRLCKAVALAGGAVWGASETGCLSPRGLEEEQPLNQGHSTLQGNHRHEASQPATVGLALKASPRRTLAVRDGELPCYVYRISNRKTSRVCLRQNSDVCAKGTHPIAFWGLHALPGKEGKDCLSRTYPAVSRFQVFNMHGLGPQATVLEPQAHPYQQASLLKLHSVVTEGDGFSPRAAAEPRR